MSKTKEELIASVKAMAGKIENKGKTPEGKLSSEEFNDIQALIIELAENCSTRTELVHAIETLPFYTKAQILQMLEQKANATAVTEALSQKQGVIADLDAIRQGAQKGMNSLQSSDIAAWAKSPNKPSYTPQEVGALPANTPIPAADNEDLQNVNGALKLADKAYDASTHSGLGRKYLRKNIVSNKNVLTQAMVNTANTIYHIQYDYDLNGQTLTLPTGCVLEFDGGSVKNGTLSGDFNIIAGLETIFDGVTFTGACINNTYELDWFIGNKNTSVDLTATKKDSTTEVQAAFNSGVMNFHVSNKYYYYLSAKVTIKSWVALVGEKIAFTHQRNADNAEPCFYTDQAITMMEVVGDSDNNTKIQKEIILDEIHFRHFGPITNGDYHEATPILLVTNGQGVNPQVWGVRLNVHILFSDRNIAELGKYMYGYTGIEINATNGYLTYLDVSGNVRGVRRAIYVHKTSTAWITDTRLSFDTNAVRGGEVLATPIRLTGSHQPVIQLTAQELAENPCYFKVGNGTSTAMVWDLGATDVAEGVTYYNVTKAFETTTDAFHDFISSRSPVIPQTAMLPAGNNDFRWREEELWKFLSLYPNLLELVFHNIKGWQLLDNAVTGIAGGQSNKMRGVLESVRAYKTTNDYIELTPNDVRNWARIPCLGGVSTRQAQMDFVESNKPCINSSIIAAGYKNFEVCYTFSKKSVFDFAKKNSYLAVNADWTSGEANTIYLSIEFCDDTDTILETQTIYFNATSNIYYTDTYLQYFKFVDSATAYTYIRLRFRDFRTLTASTPVARFGIIGLSFTNNIITAAGGEVAGPMVLRSLKLDENNNNAGCRILHNDYLSRSIALTTNYKPILNICSYFQSQVIVTLVKSTGGVAIVTLNKSYLYCSDHDISCKLEIHTDNYAGRYFLSVKAKENINVYIADVYSPNSIKFYDLAEVHQEGYFDTTFTTDIILTSGTSGQRPVLQASDKGFTYFDTTLDRLLFWNGIGWMGIVEESILLDYLVMEAEGTGVITLTIPASIGTSELSKISYSLNGFNWVETDNVDNTQVVITTPEITAGQKVYWKGTGRKTASSENDCSTFSSTTDFSVSGNLLSLIEGDDFEGKELTNRSYAFTKLFMGAPVTDASELKLTASSLGTHVYSHLFHDCTKLVAAPNLSACTSLATYNYQYAYMFKGCTSLIAAPDLPATIVGVASYYEMFNGCINLESAPAELPATTLASNCYRGMFISCAKLTTAPVLPAVTLEQYCYYNMFYGCTLLNYVKAMFTTTPANAYTYNWLYNVATTGTFVKNAAAEWTLSGATGIPSGWTTQTESAE